MQVIGLLTKNTSGAEVEVTPSNPLPVSSGGYISSATFTRPNDTNAYSAGDAVSNSTSAPSVMTFANIGPAGAKVLITNATLEIDVAAVPSGMTSFRLHLYSSAPTAINDNAAYDLPSGDRAKYLGWLDLPQPTSFTSTLFGQNVTDRTQVQLAAASTSLYGIMQTVGSYTPTASAVKLITLKAVQVG